MTYLLALQPGSIFNMSAIQLPGRKYRSMILGLIKDVYHWWDCLFGTKKLIMFLFPGDQMWKTNQQMHFVFF